MLRLTPPDYEKIRMATSFQASYGGSEANIALALANLGIDSTFFSVVPNNSVGKSAVRMLRSNDVHCTPMILSTPEETPHPTVWAPTTWRRATASGPARSPMTGCTVPLWSTTTAGVDLDALLEGFDWLHLSGITPRPGSRLRQAHPGLFENGQGPRPHRQL